MEIQCSVCRRFEINGNYVHLGINSDISLRDITHTYCDPCYKTIMEEIDLEENAQNRRSN